MKRTKISYIKMVARTDSTKSHASGKIKNHYFRILRMGSDVFFDILWCQRVMLSVLQRKRWEYHCMGIDMSSAFDTIRRSTILDLLVECGCDEDEIRLIRLLQSNTKLRVNVNGSLSAEFQSFLGAFQGDCLSGCLFTLVLAGALRDLRNRLTTSMARPNPQG